MKDGFAIVLVIVCVLSVMWWWVFYLLWNYIAAGVFGLPELTFWQSVGLLLLLSLVFLYGHVVSNVVRGDK